jgi:hypothetical protein
MYDVSKKMMVGLLAVGVASTQVFGTDGDTATTASRKRERSPSTSFFSSTDFCKSKEQFLHELYIHCLTDSYEDVKKTIVKLRKFGPEAISLYRGKLFLEDVIRLPLPKFILTEDLQNNVEAQALNVQQEVSIWEKTITDLKIIDELIRWGIPIDTKNRHGETALDIAITLATKTSHETVLTRLVLIISALLEHGATYNDDINSWKRYNLAEDNQWHIVELLLDAVGNDEMEMLMITAIKKNNVSAAEMLFSHDFDLSLCSPYVYMEYVLKNGSIPMAQCLLNHGLDVSATNANGKTVVDWFNYENFPNGLAIKALLEQAVSALAS